MSLRSALALAAFASAVLFAHAGEDKHVTFRSTAASADHLLKALGDAAGVPLRATPTTARDILAVAVKDVPLSVVMRKIAEAENASWEAEGNGFRLNRSTEQNRADADAEHKHTAARLADGLAKITAEAKALKPLSEQSARALVQRAKDVNSRADAGNVWPAVQQINGETPVGRLLVRLAANLSADTLATIPENGRIVFSDAPNRMQRKLPGIGSAIQQYVREQAVLSGAAEPISSDDMGNGYFQLRSFSAALKEAPSKVILAVERRPFDNGMQCKLEILDAQDHVLGNSDRRIGVSPFEDLNPTMLAKPVAGEKPIEFSEDSKALRAIFRTMNGGNVSSSTAPPELKKKIADPFNNEPLGFVTGEAVLGYAEAHKANLVAALSDASAVMLFPMGDDMMPTVVGTFLRAADESVTEADGWIVIKPNNPVTTRESRSDRTALTKLLHTAQAKGVLTIDDAATYAVSCPALKIDIIAMLTATVIQPSAIATFEQNGMPTLRFYGLLTPVQRQLARAAQPISLATVTGAQAACLSEMVFGTESRLNNERTMTYEEGQAPVFPTNESTELLPNGIPPSGRFTLTMKSESVVIPMREGGVSMSDSGMTANELAWRSFAQENPAVGGSWASDPRHRVDLNALQLGERMTIEMQFELSDKAGFNQNLKQISPAQGRLALKDLPEAFRKAFEKALEDMKKNNWGVGGPPAGSPPPPEL